MPKYKPDTLWLRNESGRVVHVASDSEQALEFSEGGSGWTKMSKQEMQDHLSFWIVNDTGRVVCVAGDSPQAEHARSGAGGFRVASKPEIHEAKVQMEADSKHWKAIREKEIEAKRGRMSAPRSEARYPEPKEAVRK